MKIIQVTDKIFLIPGKHNGRFPGSNSFLVKGNRTALIDTGCGIDLLKSLKNEIPVDFIINSHCHPDHSAGNSIFDNIPLHVPIESKMSHGQLKPLSERLTEPGYLAAKWIEYVTDVLGYRERVPTDFFREGDIFDLNTVSLHAVHTPGHTMDHYCFFEPVERILFSFDLDLTSFGPFYGHRESSLELLRMSIRRIRELNPAVIISSHREIIKNDIDGEIARFERILEQRELRILEMAEKGMSFDEILDVSPFYGKYPYAPELMKFWEGQMIRKHLDEMVAKGLIAGKGKHVKGICSV